MVTRTRRLIATASLAAVGLGIGGAAVAPAQAFDNPLNHECFTNCYPLPLPLTPTKTGPTPVCKPVTAGDVVKYAEGSGPLLTCYD